jgi:hypothetical protein
MDNDELKHIENFDEYPRQSKPHPAAIHIVISHKRMRQTKLSLPTESH